MTFQPSLARALAKINPKRTTPTPDTDEQQPRKATGPTGVGSLGGGDNADDNPPTPNTSDYVKSAVHHVRKAHHAKTIRSARVHTKLALHHLSKHAGMRDMAVHGMEDSDEPPVDEHE